MKKQINPICIDFRIRETLLEMIFVPVGKCTQIGNQTGENPRLIEISKPFILGKYPVTCLQWKELAPKYDDSVLNDGSSPHFGPSTNFLPSANRLPVEGVTITLANNFCDLLSKELKLSFMIPTEDEWEYACRGGLDLEFPIGDPIDNPERYCRGSTRQQGYIESVPLSNSVPANRFGLFGMQGYIPQWCVSCDALHETTDKKSFILRGGSRNSSETDWRVSSTRSGGNRSMDKSGGFGFRVKCECSELLLKRITETPTNSFEY